MKSKSSSRKHSVKAQIQILDLTRAGSSMRFEIYADDEKLGEIDLGRGSINWIGKRRRSWGKPISWSKFAEMMDEASYPKR